MGSVAFQRKVTKKALFNNKLIISVIIPIINPPPHKLTRPRIIMMSSNRFVDVRRISIQPEFLFVAEPKIICHNYTYSRLQQNVGNSFGFCFVYSVKKGLGPHPFFGHCTTIL
jgi:hypothetical protein